MKVPAQAANSVFNFTGGGTAPDESIGCRRVCKINLRGDVVGFRGNAYSFWHGFSTETENHKALSFVYPDAFLTGHYGMTESVHFTGFYLLGNNATHGFIAT